MIPQSEQEHKDIIDLIIEGAQSIEQIESEDGSVVKSLIIDPEKIYWKTQLVNSPTFARFVLELKNFEGLAQQAYSYMSEPRAKGLSFQILSLVQAYKYSIDSKSSESLRNSDNTQSTLIDKIKSNKIERSYKMKGEKTRNMWDAIVGKDKENDLEND